MLKPVPKGRKYSRAQATGEDHRLSSNPAHNGRGGRVTGTRLDAAASCALKPVPQVKQFSTLNRNPRDKRQRVNFIMDHSPCSPSLRRRSCGSTTALNSKSPTRFYFSAWVTSTSSFTTTLSPLHANSKSPLPRATKRRDSRFRCAASLSTPPKTTLRD